MLVVAQRVLAEGFQSAEQVWERLPEHRGVGFRPERVTQAQDSQFANSGQVLMLDEIDLEQLRNRGSRDSASQC